MPKLGTPTIITAADGLAVPGRGTNVLAVLELFNGATFDRFRNNEEVTLLASAQRGVSVTSPDQTNHNAKGLLFYLDISARTVGASPLISLDLRTIDPVSGNVRSIVTSANFDPTVAVHWGMIYPGSDAVLVGTIGGELRIHARSPLPRTWNLRIVHEADVTNLTYSLAAAYIM